MSTEFLEADIRMVQLELAELRTVLHDMTQTRTEFQDDTWKARIKFALAESRRRCPSSVAGLGHRAELERLRRLRSALQGFAQNLVDAGELKFKGRKPSVRDWFAAPWRLRAGTQLLAILEEHSK